MARFEMDPNWEETVNRAVKDQFQDAVDAVFRTHAGRSREEVMVALRTEFPRRGIELPDSDLETFADPISNGNRVQVQM